MICTVIEFSRNVPERRSATCLAFHHRKLSLRHLAMPFGQMISGKIIEIVATRSHILRFKCIKFYFGWGSASDPTLWRSFQRSPECPDSLAVFKGI